MSRKCETSDFRWDDYNVRTWQSPTSEAKCDLVVGEQYLLQVDGPRKVRVLLITKPMFNENTNELRAHVVVLEKNPYVEAGTECRPLAFTLEAIK